MRTGSYWWLPLVAATLVVWILIGSACASANGGPVAVTLAQLVSDEGAYDGRDVQTQGTVRQFQDPAGTVYDVIEDSRPDRVELEPASAGSPYVGQQVVVVGTFHFDDQ